MPPARELAALVVAVGASAAVLVLAVGAAREIASTAGHLSDVAGSILATSLGAMIGAVAAYLGHDRPPPD